MSGRPYDLYNSMYHRGAISPSHDVITVCLPIKAIETNQTNSNSVCLCVCGVRCTLNEANNNGKITFG